MSKPEAVQQKSSSVSYLIIDDEIAADPISKEDFVDDLGFVNTKPQFVASCEEAINVLQKNLEIKFCFLDCKLPRTINDSVNYDPDNSSDYGIQLIDQIVEINQQLPIIVFSAYVDRTELQVQTKNNSNIVGYLRKDESPESYRAAFKLAIQHCGISIEDFESDNSILTLQKSGFDYNELPAEDSLIIRQKTENIKRLARLTAETIIEIGKNIVEVKEKLQKGQFYIWAKAEFPWTTRTINRFMNVYTRFNDIPIEDLDLIPVSALYELSSKSVDDEAITETIDLAKAEGGVTIAQAREIKQKYSFSQNDISSTNKQQLSSENSTTQKHDNSDDWVVIPDTRETTSAKSDNDLTKPISKLSPDSAISKPSETKPQLPKLKQQIIKVLPQQRLWKIDDHVIYNGEPNSEGFLRLLPSQSSICLNFSSDPHFRFDYQNYHSWLSLYSKHSDLDSNDFLKIIDQIVASSTEESDSVIVLYIPNEDILNVIHDLYCKAYIVDPDPKKCLKLANQRINNIDRV